MTQSPLARRALGGALMAGALVGALAAAPGVACAAALAPPSAPPSLAAAPIVVGTHPFPPWIVHGADGGWSGISVDCWKLVAARLGRPFVVKDVPEEERLLHPERGGFEVLVSATISSRTEGWMDMSHAFFSTGLSIAVRAQPRSGLAAVGAKVLTLGFLRNLGLLALVVVLMGAIVWRVERHANPNAPLGALRGIGAGIFWTVESLFGKGKSLSGTTVGRLVSLFWVFACMLLVSGVTAKLSSEFTVSQLSASISGPNDLPRVRVATVKPSAAQRYLDRRGIPHRDFESPAQALAALDRDEVDAVVEESPTLRYFAHEQFRGRLAVLPGTFENHGYGFGLRSGSSLRKGVNLAVLQLAEQGLFTPVFNQYLGASTD